MGGTTGLGVVVVMVAFPKRREPNPEIILALVRRLEGAIAKLFHVADGIHRPGKIVGDQDRDIEAPEKATQPEKGEKRRGDEQMRDNIKSRSFPKPAVPDFAHVGRIPQRAFAERRRLADQPHHMGVRKAVPRTVNVFFGIRLEMMIAVIPNPGNGIARETDGRAGGEEELQPTRHLKAPMGQITMQIKSRTEPQPEIERDHDREIDKLKPCPKRRHPEELQENKNAENDEINFFVLEHEEAVKQQAGLGEEAAVSAAKETRASSFCRENSFHFSLGK